MIDLPTYTLIHTALSLIALAAGLIVGAGLARGEASRSWSWLFIVTAFLTSATGFGFPVKGILPSHIVGVLALGTLAIAMAARFLWRFKGAWRWLYAVGIVINVYLLAFVTVFQAFGKVPFLHALAPTASESPFAVTQLTVLVLFLVLGIAAARRFRPGVDLEEAPIYGPRAGGIASSKSP
jgi:hypothetical protein